MRTPARVFYAIALVAACGKPVPADSTDGPKIFTSYCSTCHGPDGRPPAAMVARLGVKDLTAPELRKRINPGLVELQIRKGSDNKLMPSFEGVMTDEQMRAVAAWVANPAFVTPPP